MIPVRIPIRVYRDLPGDLAWVITEKHINGRNRLVVYLASDIEPDSPLEQHFVRQATRAWRQRHHGALVIPPVIAGSGWLARKLAQPRAAAVAGASVVAAGVALAAAVTLTEAPKPASHRPPVAVAPPSRQPTRPPRVTPTRPTAPPKTPGKTRPKQPDPDEVDAGPVSVDLPTAPRVRVPKVPPVRVRPPVTAPKVPALPVTPTPPPVAASRCRLVELQVGKLVRVCL